MCIELWWNDNEKERPKYFVGNKVSRCQIANCRSHMDCPRLEHRPPVANCYNTEQNVKDPFHPLLPDV
jgi:hypothetical protein